MEQDLDKYTHISFYWDFFARQFETNDLFVGLLVLSLMGSVAFILRGIPRMVYNFIVAQFTVTMTVQSEDPLYEFLKLYLSKLNYAKNHCRRLTLSSSYTDRAVSAYTDRVVSASENIEPPPFTLTPSEGNHWFPFNNNIIFYERAIDDHKGQGARKETIKIRYIGRSKNLLNSLVDDIMKLRKFEKKTVDIFRASYDSWYRLAEKMKRPLSTIFIKKEVKDYIVDDMKWFLENEQWYQERGIPYRRGYMFTGKPGTGKTSIVKALAAELNMDICVCNISSIDDDDSLISLVSHPKPNAIILLEDIDACIASDKRVSKSQARPEGAEEAKGVTLSGLLNALDGVVSPDRQIFIMTTNHPENIDPAILRRGRTDVEIEFEYIGAELVEEMFCAFFPEKTQYAKDIAAELTKDGDVSPADLQGRFFEYAKDPDGFVNSVLPKKKKSRKISESEDGKCQKVSKEKSEKKVVSST